MHERICFFLFLFFFSSSESSDIFGPGLLWRYDPFGSPLVVSVFLLPSIHPLDRKIEARGTTLPTTPIRIHSSLDSCMYDLVAAVQSAYSL